MTSLAHTLRTHRESARSRRALSRVLSSPMDPASRDDLIMAMQGQHGLR